MNMYGEGNAYTCLDTHTQEIEKGICRQKRDIGKENRHRSWVMCVCVNMFRYKYAEIREMKMQMEKEDRHRSRVVCIHVLIHVRRN